MDVLDQSSLVLERITLGRGVQRVVEVVCDLARISVLTEKSSENSLSSHPSDGSPETCLACTMSLSRSRVSSHALGSCHFSHSASAVYYLWFDDDQAILDELSNIMSRVGTSDL